MSVELLPIPRCRCRAGWGRASVPLGALRGVFMFARQLITHPARTGAPPAVLTANKTLALRNKYSWAKFEYE